MVQRSHMNMLCRPEANRVYAARHRVKKLARINQLVKEIENMQVRIFLQLVYLFNYNFSKIYPPHPPPKKKNNKNNKTKPKNNQY